MTAGKVSIRAETDKAITPRQELALLRAAYQRSPTQQIKQQLTRLLLMEEAFDEVVELLTATDLPDFRSEMALHIALISAETASSNRMAAAAAERALQLAANNAERSAALAGRGKCEMRLDQTDKALATLTEALALDPNNRDACKRMAAIELGRDRPAVLLTLVDDLVEKGANHPWLFAAQSLANARLDEIAKARLANGFDTFHHTEQLVPPAGWDSIEEFNTALAQELLTHPDMRYERYGSASELTWRIENPARADAPLFKTLIAQIIGVLENRVAEIGRSNTYWASAATNQGYLRNWCVITESDGFETWHVHQFGWLSGVYYVKVPASIADGRNHDGCLAFGLPEHLAGKEGADAFGEHVVRPREGLLLTFPSQCFHRTYPHRTGEKRICVAFDLRPE